MAGLLEVGRIVKPHGLSGEVIVELVTNRPDRRLAPGTVLSSAEGDLEVVCARPHQNRWIVAFVGVADRNGAERLRDRRLVAEPLEEEGALWVHELIGTHVVDAIGRTFGPVDAVEANPASDLLVLQGGHLVPLVFVTGRTPDGKVVIDPPAGLFEDWEEVFLLPPDPAWPARFAAEAARLGAALADAAVRIEHYGSTAVPGLAAKPVIDILVAVPALDPAAPYRGPLEGLGYAFVEHPENAATAFLGWPSDRPRLFDVHVMEAGGHEERRHLAFRDHLRSYPAAAAAYGELKGDLARRFPHDIEAYTRAKSAFIAAVERRAGA